MKIEVISPNETLFEGEARLITLPGAFLKFPNFKQSCSNYFNFITRGYYNRR